MLDNKKRIYILPFLFTNYLLTTTFYLHAFPHFVNSNALPRLADSTFDKVTLVTVLGLNIFATVNRATAVVRIGMFDFANLRRFFRRFLVFTRMTAARNASVAIVTTESLLIIQILLHSHVGIFGLLRIRGDNNGRGRRPESCQREESLLISRGPTTFLDVVNATHQRNVVHLMFRFRRGSKHICLALGAHSRDGIFRPLPRHPWCEILRANVLLARRTLAVANQFRNRADHECRTTHVWKLQSRPLGRSIDRRHDSQKVRKLSYDRRANRILTQSVFARYLLQKIEKVFQFFFTKFFLKKKNLYCLFSTTIYYYVLFTTIFYFYEEYVLTHPINGRRGRRLSKLSTPFLK